MLILQLSLASRQHCFSWHFTAPGLTLQMGNEVKGDRKSESQVVAPSSLCSFHVEHRIHDSSRRNTPSRIPTSLLESRSVGRALSSRLSLLTINCYDQTNQTLAEAGSAWKLKTIWTVGAIQAVCEASFMHIFNHKKSNPKSTHMPTWSLLLDFLATHSIPCRSGTSIRSNMSSRR